MAWQGIIITGASSGIGEALALGLAAPGVTLGLVGRHAGRLAGVAIASREKGAVVREGLFDIRDAAALRAFMDDFAAAAPLDLVVANAGILDGRTPDGVIETAAAARNLLDTNLLASIETLHATLPHMRRRKSGQILLVTSQAGLAPLPDAPAYSASKAGLISYGLAMREALREEGIRVNVVCPGYVTSGMTAVHQGPHPFKISAQAAAQKIIAGLRADRGLFGFPLPLFLLARCAIAAPAWIRRLVMNGMRFRVARYDGQKPL
jgi:short-subunit dehydrogenase